MANPGPMDHQEFDHRIDDFLTGKLKNADLDRFLAHYDSCSSCREELSIRFLIARGLEKLEKGDSFNLNRELREMIRRAREKSARAKLTEKLLWTALILGALAAGIFLLWIILM